MSRRHRVHSGSVAWVVVLAIFVNLGSSAGAQKATPAYSACAPTRSATPSPSIGSAVPSRIGTPVVFDCLQVTLAIDSQAAGPRTLRVTVTSNSGQPLQTVSVAIQLHHLTMDHGTSSYEAIRLAPDLFEVEKASMGMAGPWQVSVLIDQPGTANVQAVFEIELTGTD